MPRGMPMSAPGTRPMGDISGKRDTKYILKKLGHYLYQYRFLMALALTLTLLSNALALVGPSLSGYAIDAIVSEGNVRFDVVGHYALLMIAF
ncbi:MAG: hypothetical protein J5998_05800, partial [Clostridia bacterium]|nr:hypothetical protein [Clostridia bacterium]